MKLMTPKASVHRYRPRWPPAPGDEGGVQARAEEGVKGDGRGV